MIHASPIMPVVSLVMVTLFLLTACRKVGHDSEPKATATEIFHLRSECANLADKIMPANGNYGSYGVWLSTVTRYNPDTNRCYALGTVRYNFPDLSMDYDESTLFDAQTREELAVRSFPVPGSARKPSGIVLVYGIVELSGLNPAHSYEEADEYIGKIMEDHGNPTSPQERK